MSTHPKARRRFAIIVLFLVIVFGIQSGDLRAQSDLDAADSALLHGDYETAIAAYNAALADPASQCDALYGLGQTHLRASQVEESITAFTRYLNECELEFHALVMRGQARQQAGHSAEALADYQQAIDLRPGVLDSYLYERMAALDPDRGIFYLRLASEAPRDISSRIDLRETLAEAYLLIGDVDSALAEYDLILREIDDYRATLGDVEGVEFDENGSRRARIEYTAAQVEIEHGRPQAGYERLQRVITQYPETDSALPALVDLIVGGQSVDLLLRMRINVRNENYFPVVDVLEGYLSDPATSASAPPELFLLLGQAQRGMGDHNAALETFSRVTTQFPDAPEASAAMLYLGHTYVDIGSPEQALQTYLQLMDMYPQAPEMSQALLAAADVERRAGNLSNAMTLYRRLAQAYPESEQTREGIFEAGQAVSAIDPVAGAELFGLSGTARGRVWEGKTHQRSGNLEAAQRAWRQATAVEPGTLFAMRACALLNDIDLFTPSDSLHIEPVTDAERAEVEGWVAQTFGPGEVSAALSPELANDPILQRATALWAVGMWSQARAEFDTLHQQNRDNPAALLQLAFHYHTIPVYRSSLFAATRLVFASGQPFTQIPRALLRLAYPFYMADVLVPAAEAYGLDPLLVAALVRQESSFDPTAQSFAGARGLMQLMPATAHDVASRIGRTDFALSELNRPVVNAELGSYYLSSVLSFQGGSIPGALLGYNAGPGTAANWLQSAGDDLEQIYETIPFDETRLYLELIAENHTVYKHLYGDPVPACMFEGLPDSPQ